MRTRAILGLALVAIACSATTALAQEKKAKGVPGMPRLNVFSPMAYAVEPNIEAILAFTDDQRDKLGKAIQETVKAPALAELLPKKGEPADKAKSAKAKEEMQKAQAELKKRVGEILTPEQKATIQKVDDALQHALDGALSKEQKDKLEGLKKPKKGK